MTGWFEIAQNDKGQFSFVLKAANAQVVLHSQQYESKASAQGGVARPCGRRSTATWD